VYENDGSGSFTDVTPLAISSVARETRGVTALDMDGDGDLDLFAVPGPEDNPGVNEAYRNDASVPGAFAFSAWAGDDLTSTVAMQGVIDTDFDGDGDVDLLSANRFDRVFAILQNDGFGFFQQILPSTLGFGVSAQDSISTADVDNDGDLDVLLATNNVGHLYTRDAGLYTRVQIFSDVQGYMGGFADLDNDGDLDLVFAGDERIFINDGSGSFASGQSVPVSEISDPRAIAFADIDGDGDLDFAIAAKDSRNWLVQNDIDAAAGNWLRVELISAQGQAGAFGAKVSVFITGGGTLLGMREAKGNYGYLAQDEPVLHFGLGSETSVDVVVDFVDDPGVGASVTCTGVTAGQRILIDATQVDPCPP